MEPCSKTSVTLLRRQMGAGLALRQVLTDLKWQEIHVSLVSPRLGTVGGDGLKIDHRSLCYAPFWCYLSSSEMSQEQSRLWR